MSTIFADLWAQWWPNSGLIHKLELLCGISSRQDYIPEITGGCKYLFCHYYINAIIIYENKSRRHGISIIVISGLPYVSENQFNAQTHSTWKISYGTNRYYISRLVNFSTLSIYEIENFKLTNLINIMCVCALRGSWATHARPQN